MSQIVGDKQNLGQLKLISSYPKDLIENLRLLEMNSGGDTLQIIGSASYRDILYPSDIDSFEYIASDESKQECLDFFVKQIKKIVNNYLMTEGHYFLEVKAGIDHRYDINPGSYEFSYYKLNPELEQIIKTYMMNDLMSEEDGLQILHSLKDSSLMSYEIIKKIIRKYRIIRWTASEINKGRKKLMGNKTIKLIDAIDDQSSKINIEVISIVNNKLYDMSNFFILLYDDKKTPFADLYCINIQKQSVSDFKTYFSNSLKMSMKELTESQLEYNPMKYVKRIYSYARFEKDEIMMNKVLQILNGSLGQMYQTKSEIATILKLMSTLKSQGSSKYPKKVILSQIEWIKYRLSNFTVINLELLETLNIILDKATKLDWDFIEQSLENLKKMLTLYINSATTELLQRENLLPIPFKYRITKM
jgi:hypothetical protein